MVKLDAEVVAPAMATSERRAARLRGALATAGLPVDDHRPGRGQITFAAEGSIASEQSSHTIADRPGTTAVCNILNRG